MPDERRVGYLEGLVHELADRGLVARVIRSRSGPAFCRVVNPEAASLSENVMCAPAPGTADQLPWFFWWSWGEPLHGVDDPHGAAVKVARVLEAHRD
ncbi:MAG: hypothetical protein JWP48_6569 [Actinoallomurus sp.]|jgi:hypothetical protein|nr:hypothetical protein [Actinoallomurus sp.]